MSMFSWNYPFMHANFELFTTLMTAIKFPTSAGAAPWKDINFDTMLVLSNWTMYRVLYNPFWHAAIFCQEMNFNTNFYC